MYSDNLDDNNILNNSNNFNNYNEKDIKDNNKEFDFEDQIQKLIKNLYDEILNENIKSDNLEDNLYNSKDKINDNINTLNNLNKNTEEIIIQFENSDHLEKIQEDNYQKILNSVNNIIIKFIIPKKLIKTKVLRFYKCWKKGYCLNNSEKKIPENVKKILLKKL